ncbi:MAG: MqnA/MqnD/SBP family protein, partial [Rubricoccaceae bacterium]
MRLATWPAAPARVLADALVRAGLVSETTLAHPFEAAGALAGGLVDLALVPALDVLRAPERFAAVPGAGLVGEADPLFMLLVRGPLDAVRTVAFDPRYGQHALVAQLVFREHYDAHPAFALAPPGAAPEALLARHEAALVPRGTPVPPGAVALDLGLEWTELTLRPMVWGLLAARPGTLPPPRAAALAGALRRVPPEALAPEGAARAFQLTLDGYAMDGLDELATHLFYAGTLSDIPAVPFASPETPVPGEDAPGEDAPGED